MKRIIAIILAAVMLSAALVSCAFEPKAPAISANIRTTSSDATDAAAWLTARLGDKLTDRVVIGTSADGYGIDLAALEDDGYIIRALGDEVALFARTADGLDRAARKYARMSEAGTIEDVTYHEGYRVKRLTIAGNEISEYAIVIPDRADEATPFGASELSTYIEKTCGAYLPIFTADEYEAAEKKPPRRIVITYGDASLGDEGFKLSIAEDGTLTIAGGIWRGSLYGVYDLLEDIGWRFLGAGGSAFPRTAFIPIPKREYLYESEHVDLTSAINRTEIPSIPIRGYGDRDAHVDPAPVGDAMQLTRQKFSYTSYNHYGFANPACHGLQGNHSMIFSGEYEGLYDAVRGTQPCLTNEDILEAIDNYALTLVKRRLDAGQTIGKECNVVDVAQWDGKGFCDCKNCLAVEKIEGSHSGPIVRMANRVCALLDENYPGVCASILAYFGSDTAPAVTKPAHNLYVAFCFYVDRFYGGCQNHCISGEECGSNGNITNAVFAERFKGWADIMDGKMLQVWMYPSNCYNTCYNAPLYLTLIDNARFLASYGVGHVYHDTRWVNNGLILEELSVYLLLRFEWDATITDEEAIGLMREWFRLVYGDAGDLMFELTMFAEQAGDRAGCWGSFNNATCDRVDYGFVSENAERIWELCDKLPEMAASAGEEALIERYIAGFLFMTLRARYDDMYVNGDADERGYITGRYREVWELFTKYHLATFTTLNSNFYAPETFDPDVDPQCWIDNSVNVTD